jgi:hypothetical protein
MNHDDLNRLAKDRYGAALLDLDPTAALWVAEAATRETGVNQWAYVDLVRSRYGRFTAYPAYGSTCFPRLARYEYEGSLIESEKR